MLNFLLPQHPGFRRIHTVFTTMIGHPRNFSSLSRSLKIFVCMFNSVDGELESKCRVDGPTDRQTVTEEEEKE